MNNKNFKVSIKQATRQAIINAFIMGHIDERDIHNIVKVNKIKLFN